MSALIFDTETTGNEPAEIIEAAWLKINNPVDLIVTEEYEERFKPQEKISLGALATHHILDEELRDCPPAASFSLPADTKYIIGHNIDYDWNVSGQPAVKRICTLAIARHLIPSLDSHSQSALIYYFDRNNARERLQKAHSALADVHNCRLNLLALFDCLEEQGRKAPTDWEELWQLSEQARIPSVMPFGKHRGQLIAKLPRDYQDWLLRQDGLDPYVKQAVLQSRQA
ncbi:MAG TPA: DUF3820 family protein [Paenalcaligenes sp.]|nr:DUF3820 family protein [Paenalcaligenes sp.]